MKSDLSTRIRFRSFALGTALPLMALGCGPSPSATGQAVLTVSQPSVTIGDPHIVSDASGPLSIIYSIYEALVGLDEEGGFQPVLAERWEVGENSKCEIFAIFHGFFMFIQCFNNKNRQ